MYLGKKSNNIQIEETYLELALEDEQAGHMLKFNRMYRHSIYFYIQSMEKHIRAKIFTLVSAENKYFRERNKDHSLDKAVEFLMEVIAKDSIVREQILEQIKTNVLGDIKYNQLHNNLRYPFYQERYQNFSIIEYGENDCLMIESNLQSLKIYLRELKALQY